MKIDIFPHIFPQAFFDRILRISGRVDHMQKRIREIPVLIDLETRFRIMDRYEGYRQVLTLASPPLEVFGDRDTSPELARIANDGMAGLVDRYPDRFPAFIASLCMNNMDACMVEVDRAIGQLGARGVQVFSNVNGHPLDEPVFRPLFQYMAEVDLPIWLHPSRPAHFPDYPVEKMSRYEIWWLFGWPYETSVAMTRLVFSGLFDDHPDLKIITHHLGAMIPYFAGRLGPGLDQLGSRTPDESAELIRHRLKRRPADYFPMFYGDTALFGAVSPLETGIDYFGVDRVLFGSDMPFDPEKGEGFIRDTIRAIDSLSLTAEDRTKIYEGNARRLLKLPD